ncbi:hypothetical protein D6777_01800 [Candidatus Woesearchaeota archaeon]|nr:MAG: hypothetical protein D6777_01800 [Candidatus Woesearchaeota archaeon]
MDDYVKTEYKKLQQKYNLPEYKKFNDVFEIVSIEENKSGKFANALTRVVHGKIKFFLTFFDPFLLPQPNSAYMMIVSKDIGRLREGLLEVYKELMVDYNNGYLVLLKGEKEMMNYVKDIWKKHEAYKKKLIKFIEELNKIVLKTTDVKENKGYLG